MDAHLILQLNVKKPEYALKLMKNVWKFTKIPNYRITVIYLLQSNVMMDLVYRIKTNV